MPRKTVDELEAEIADLKAGRQKVVDEALKLKAEQGYCDEVDRVLSRAGLSDLLPYSIVVQIRDASNYSWHDVMNNRGWRGKPMTFPDTAQGRKDALAYAEKQRTDCVNADIRSFKEREADRRRFHRNEAERVSSRTRHLGVVVTKDTKPEDVASTVKKMVEDLAKPAPEPAPFKPGKLTVYKYPKYRVVRKQSITKPRDAEILGLFDFTEVPAKSGA